MYNVLQVPCLTLQNVFMSGRDQEDFNSEVLRKHNEYRQQHGDVSCSHRGSTGPAEHLLRTTPSKYGRR